MKAGSTICSGLDPQQRVVIFHGNPKFWSPGKPPRTSGNNTAMDTTQRLGRSWVIMIQQMLCKDSRIHHGFSPVLMKFGGSATCPTVNQLETSRNVEVSEGGTLSTCCLRLEVSEGGSLSTCCLRWRMVVLCICAGPLNDSGSYVHNHFVLIIGSSGSKQLVHYASMGKESFNYDRLTMVLPRDFGI